MYEFKTDWTAQRFSTAIEPIVKNREAEYNLALGLLERALANLVDSYEMLLATSTENNNLNLALLQTRPHNMILVGDDKDAAGSLAQYLCAQNRKTKGVVGPPTVTKAFAQEWMRWTGLKKQSEIPQGIYRLDKVISPPKAEGRLRYGNFSDLKMLTNWMYDFCCEAIPEDETSREDAQKLVEPKLNQRFAFLWEANGVPVCMASLTRPARGGVCVNGVYTPPAHRKKGYASQLVASVSDHALSKGFKFCTLYTDLRNPTSNSIYSKLGYRRVADSLMVKW